MPGRSERRGVWGPFRGPHESQSPHSWFVLVRAICRPHEHRAGEAPDQLAPYPPLLPPSAMAPPAAPRPAPMRPPTAPGLAMRHTRSPVEAQSAATGTAAVRTTRGAGLTTGRGATYWTAGAANACGIAATAAGAGGGAGSGLGRMKYAVVTPVDTAVIPTRIIPIVRLPEDSWDQHGFSLISNSLRTSGSGRQVPPRSRIDRRALCPRGAQQSRRLGPFPSGARLAAPADARGDGLIASSPPARSGWAATTARRKEPIMVSHRF